MDKKADSKMREINEMRNVFNAFKRRYDYIGSLSEKTKKEIKEQEMLEGDMSVIKTKLMMMGEEV